MDEFEHPVLGVFRPQGDDGWLGRSDPGPDFYDLFVMRAGEDEAPAEAALALLARAAADIGALKARAVEAVCAARQARLNWRAGPPLEAWSITELRVDAASALWLTLHEYETDEYSRWLVCLGGPGAPVVRRIPALALSAPPAEAGVLV